MNSSHGRGTPITTAYPPPAHAPGRPSYRLRRTLVGVAVGALLAALIGLGLFTARWMTGPTCKATAGDMTFAFTPEQLRNASLITSVAIKRGLPPRAATIAIATAMQESELRNLDYGDRDSVGLFQQRPSQGWGTIEEIMDPLYAAGKFYDALVTIDDYEDRSITEVAQEVQRSAYPDAYADHEDQGRVLASALTGHSPAGIACRLGDAGTGDAAALADDLTRQLGHDAAVDGATVTVAAGSTQDAWAVAAWAAGQAERYAVTDVAAADRAWHRARDPLTWGPSAATADATTVTITVARRQRGRRD